MATSSAIHSRCDQVQLGVLDVIHDGNHGVEVRSVGKLSPSGVGLRVNFEVRIGHLTKYSQSMKKPLALTASAGGGRHSMFHRRLKSCGEIKYSYLSFASDVLNSNNSHLRVPCGDGLIA